MNWQPGASLATLRTRAAMLGRARQFFARRAVLEVETPILSAAAVSDPQLQSLHTQVAGIAQPRYLQTSPEYAMKRLLAAGSGDIYQVCKVFRDEEQGRWHHPEFTMIEWYRLGFDDAALMDEVEALLSDMLEGLRDLPSAERLSYSAALERHAGLDAFSAGDDALAAAAVRHGIHCDSTLDRDAKLDLLMGLVVGPRLGIGRPCFICDYPVSQAALARLKPGKLAAAPPGVAPPGVASSGVAPAVAARFELYLDGVELANGFHELSNGPEQRARFVADLKIRAARGQVQPPLDENLLAALQHGLPDCAGVALGFDRVVAVALGANRLSEAMSFTIENS